jgi:predicted acylesterase/phospholipase RssA
LGQRPDEDYAEIHPIPGAHDTEGFALILGGGGARGLAHIGVLEVLEEEGLIPDLIVGTSMGAILGALYASGVSVAELRELVLGQRWMELLLDAEKAPGRIQGGWAGLDHHQLKLELRSWPPGPPAGVSYGQAVESLVGGLTADALFAAGADFDKLPIPFRCVSTDVVRAAPLVSDRGALARVVRASGSMPFVFVPVEIDGFTLMDGGLVDNIPVEVARNLGFRRSLIVDVSNIFLPREGPPESFVSMARRVTHLNQRAQNHVIPTEDELLLRLDLFEFTALSFWSGEQIMDVGRSETRRALPRLRKLREELGGRRSSVEPVRRGPTKINSLTVVGNHRMSGWSLRRRLGVFPGDRIELEELWAKAEALAKQPIVHNAWVDIEPAEDDENAADVTLHVIERVLPTLELGAHHITEDGLAGFLRLRLDNLFGRGEGQALQTRLGDEHLALEGHFSQNIRGSRQLELRQWYGLQREWLEIYDENTKLDTRVFERHGGSVGVHLRPREERVTFRVRALVEDVREYRFSRTPGSARDDRMRGLEVGIETGLNGGLELAASQGLRLSVLRAFSIADATTDFWALEGGVVARRSIVGPLSSSFRGGVFFGEDAPPAWQGRAGGPEGWIGHRRDAVLEEQIVWLRSGVEYAYRPEFRTELGFAIGWTAEHLGDAIPEAGVGAFFALDSPVGPVRVGWVSQHGSKGRGVVQVGYEF